MGINEEMEKIVKETAKELEEKLCEPNKDIAKAILETQQKANESLPEHLKENIIIIGVNKNEMPSVDSEYTKHKVSSIRIGWRKRNEIG